MTCPRSIEQAARSAVCAFVIVVVSAVSALAQTTTAPPVLGDAPKDTTNAPPVLGDMPASSSFRSQKECFHEPIFGDSACVYQVNRGAPRTVVLVHGIGGQAEDWETVIPGLAAQYHVLAVDLPGFGASTRANRLYSVERYASFLHFVVERYAKQPIELVGHSLGGAVSLWYAATYPRDVERLVLVDVAGVLHRMSLAKLAANRWLADVLGELPVPGRMLGGWMDKMIGRAGNLPVNAALVLRTAVTRERVLGGDPSRISAFALAETDFTDMIPRVTVPTLVVWGTRDETASIRTGQVLAARMANARLVTVESDHVPMRAQPQRLLELTLAHLSAQEIVPSWPVHPIPPANAAVTSGRCDGQRNVKFEGAFDVLQIRGCSYVQVDNARIRQLDIADSTVFLTNSVVEGGDVAARLVNADVTATAVDFSGEVALSVDNSNLDLAGVRVEGRSAAIVGTEQPSGIIFSVSRIESPNARDSTVHDTLRASAENPM